MPELPEVETVRRQLESTVVNKKIDNVLILWPKAIHECTLDKFKSTLKNQKIIRIDRKAKYLMFIFSDVVMIGHLRMEGRFTFQNQSDNYDKNVLAIFNFTDKTSLIFKDTRKFGTLTLRSKKDYLIISPISKLGPEPFEEIVTPNFLKNKFKRKTIAVKTALLDQHILSGIGNIYANEILFCAKISPYTECKNLESDQLLSIINCSRTILKKAINAGGTTIHTFTSLNEITGKFQQQLMVHRRKGEACRVCHTQIVCEFINSRSAYFCPKCQKLY